MEAGNDSVDFTSVLLLQGVVFDLPSEFDTLVLETWKDSKNDTLMKATELPELVEFEPNGFGGGGRGGGGFHRSGSSFTPWGQRDGNGRGRGRGGFQSGNRGGSGYRNSFGRGDRGGFKRPYSGHLGGSPQNKKFKFD